MSEARRERSSARRAGLGVGALALLLGACATGAAANDRVHPEVPLWYSRPSGALQLVTHRVVTANTRRTGDDYERGRPEIDVAHGRVFVGSSDHGLYALRSTNGDTLWRFETVSLVQSEPLYDEELDLVYFGSNDGALYCVRARDGSLVFRFDTGTEVAKKPVLDRAHDLVIFANAGDYLFAIDRRTGKQKWQVHRQSALGMEIAGYAGPTLDRTTGLVYEAYSDGHVAAYDSKDGSEKWTPVDLTADAERAAGDAPRYLDADTTPVLDDHPSGRVVYVASYGGGVTALDARSGLRVWANEKVLGVTDLLLFKEQGLGARVAQAAPPTRADEDPTSLRGVVALSVLIATSAQTGMWGLDPLTGRVLWQNPVPEGGITAPIVFGGAVMVGTTRYGAFLIAPRNGKVIDGVDTGNGILATPAAYGNRAFVFTNGGSLLGFVLDRPGERVSTRHEVSSYGF